MRLSRRAALVGAAALPLVPRGLLAAGPADTSFPYALNVKKSNTTGLRAALFGSKNKAARKSVLWVGDSTQVGNFNSPGNGGRLNALRSKSPCVKLAALLTADGVPTKTDNFMGSAGASNANNLSNYDPRFAVGTGGTIGGNLCSIGGSAPGSNRANAGMIFGARTSFDRTELLFMDPDPSVEILVRVNDKLVTGFANAGTVGTPHKATISHAATNSVNFRPSSANFIFVIGASVYLSTDTAMNLIVGAWSGSRIGDWINPANPYHAGAAIPVLAPDHTFIELTIDDEATGTDIDSVYQPKLQAMIDAAKRSGTVTIVIGGPIKLGSPNPDEAVQATYWQAGYDVAAHNDLSVLDMNMGMGGWKACNAAGLMADTAHPNDRGQVLKASIMHNYMRQVMALGA